MKGRLLKPRPPSPCGGHQRKGCAFLDPIRALHRASIAAIAAVIAAAIAAAPHIAVAAAQLSARGPRAVQVHLSPRIILDRSAARPGNYSTFIFRQCVSERIGAAPPQRGYLLFMRNRSGDRWLTASGNTAPNAAGRGTGNCRFAAEGLVYAYSGVGRLWTVGTPRGAQILWEPQDLYQEPRVATGVRLLRVQRIGEHTVYCINYHMHQPVFTTDRATHKAVNLYTGPIESRTVWIDTKTYRLLRATEEYLHRGSQKRVVRTVDITEEQLDAPLPAAAFVLPGNARLIARDASVAVSLVHGRYVASLKHSGAP